MLRRFTIGAAVVALALLTAVPTAETAVTAGPHARHAHRLPAFRVTGTKGFNLNVDFPGFRGFPLTLAPTAAYLEPGSCEVHTSHRPGPPISCP